MQCINNIQSNEVLKEGDYNPYPSKTYNLVGDKTNKKKAQVKTKNETIIYRKTQDTSESDENDEANDTEANGTEAADDAPNENGASESKEEPKKAISTFTKGSKTYLTFLVMRFMDELGFSTGGKNIRTREDFVKFVNEMISKDYRFHVSRSILASVHRLGGMVSQIDKHSYTDELQKDFHNVDKNPFQTRTALLKYAGEYLCEYLKLIGYCIAQQLWVTPRKSINQSVIESVIRTLDMGNHEYYIQQKICTDEESDCGLSCGFYQDANTFMNLLLPKVVTKTKTKKPKSSTKKGKASKKPTKSDDEANEEDGNADGNEDADADEDGNADGNEDGDADEDGNADGNEDGDEEAEQASTKKSNKKAGLRKLNSD